MASLPDSSPQPLRDKVAALVESARFQNFITTVILINAVTLGLETSREAMAAAGDLLIAVDRIALSIFVVEIALKLYAFRLSFFRSGWNVFDFSIVAIALVPTAGPLSVLRALRILRVLRLISVVPSMRKVVEGLLAALPGMGSVAGVLVLIFYVGAVLGTRFFGDSFPDWFGTVGETMYTLFQIMTLESWSMGIVRPVMEEFPWAWAFFVPFILFTTFMVLNLVIGIIVDAMQAAHTEEQRQEREAIEQRAHAEREAMAEDVAAMRRELSDLRRLLEERA